MFMSMQSIFPYWTLWQRGVHQNLLEVFCSQMAKIHFYFMTPKITLWMYYTANSLDYMGSCKEKALLL